MKILLIFIQRTSPLILEALEKMQEKASSIGVNTGESTITVSNKNLGSYKLTLSLTNNTQVRVNVPGKSDVNFAGVAALKSVQMQRTKKPSGKDDGFIGEIPYKGGLCFNKDGYSVQVSYSGGTQNEDVEIAKVGISEMMFLV